jgi:hypothetical protein
MTEAFPLAKFQLGRITATPGVLELVERRRLDLRRLLYRHACGDWGDVDAQDRRANDDAANSGARILSSYGRGRRRLWIITDAATDVCPACWAGIGRCEPSKGEWIGGQHFRTDLPPRRLSTTVLRPDEY